MIECSTYVTVCVCCLRYPIPGPSVSVFRLCSEILLILLNKQSQATPRWPQISSYNTVLITANSNTALFGNVCKNSDLLQPWRQEDRLEGKVDGDSSQKGIVCINHRHRQAYRHTPWSICRLFVNSFIYLFYCALILSRAYRVYYFKFLTAFPGTRRSGLLSMGFHCFNSTAFSTWLHFFVVLLIWISFFFFYFFSFFLWYIECICPLKGFLFFNKDVPVFKAEG